MTTSDRGIDAADALTTSIFHGRYRTLTTGIVAVITVTAFEASAVVTAMPVAARELDALTWYAWTFTAFVAASLYAMVVAGQVADRVGPVRPLVLGLVALGAGSLIAGLASSMELLLVGRAVQGLGSGAQIVAVYVLIGRTYPAQMRPRVFTALSGAWLVPGIAGPALAGTIADTIGWRWVFLSVLVLLVPIGAALVPRLTSLNLPDEPSSVEQRAGGHKRRALLVAVGLALLQAAGQLLNLWGALLLVPAAAMLAVGVPRLLPQGALVLARGLPTVVMMRGFLAGAFFGVEAFVPLMLVNERGLGTAAAGMALSGAVLGWFLGAWYQGRPSTTVPRWRLLQVGSALVTVGIVLTTAAVSPSVPAWVVVPTWAVGAFGMGMLFATLGVLLLHLSPQHEQGANSAALQVADSLGVVICTGAAGAIFAAGHTAPGRDGPVFVAIFAAMAAVAGFATAVASRVRLTAPRAA